MSRFMIFIYIVALDEVNKTVRISVHCISRDTSAIYNRDESHTNMSWICRG